MKKAGIAIVVSEAMFQEIIKISNEAGTGKALGVLLDNKVSVLVNTEVKSDGTVVIGINEQATIACLKFSMRISSILTPMFSMWKAIENILIGDSKEFKRELKEIEDKVKAE